VKSIKISQVLPGLLGYSTETVHFWPPPSAPARRSLKTCRETRDAGIFL
jgi:hypothetical protein